MKKNAIMMIDFAIEAERDEGLSPDRGDHEGVPLLRFRPIEMTTPAALLGARCRSRSARASDAELVRPLGMAIMGGPDLLGRRRSTLYTTPVIYLSRAGQVPAEAPTRGWPQSGAAHA